MTSSSVRFACIKSAANMITVSAPPQSFALSGTIDLVKRLEDITWDLGPLMIWALLEADGDVVCVSAPALQPFFAGCLPSLLSRAQESSSRNRFVPYLSATERNKQRQKNRTHSYEIPSLGHCPPGG
ncbi:uncharacterized protein BCR38DRAFT_77166 [Pseudomassariella vexata]|uniref:Uncharacterized protein n=1 Tax=Pseudomassariella vexata TaxID=1141098 RepID=A0A1Y2DFR0_9PEZI|nr:uncharacterized protein BCR38DRAFT_77166 [Pseudomassariella vexata]ORY58133.1 hypothetical protein BCR38DRAFT_77166 [Pseudomassariella vexata]